MQGTGRRALRLFFAPLPRTGLCTKPCSGPCTEPCSGLCTELCSGLCAEPGSGLRARLCSGPHGSRLLPHHRHRPHHRRTAACAAPVSSASSPLTARRPHFRPHLQSTPPSASSSAARHQPATFPTTPSPVPAAARRLFSDLPVYVSHTSRNKCMHICSTH